VAIGGDGYRSWLQLERDTTTKYHSLRRTVRDNVKVTVNVNDKQITALLDVNPQWFTLDVNDKSLYIDARAEGNKKHFIISHLHNQQHLEDLKIILVTPDEHSLKSTFIWRREATHDLMDHLLQALKQIHYDDRDDVRNIFKDNGRSIEKMTEIIGKEYTSIKTNFREEMKLIWREMRVSCDGLVTLYNANTWNVKTTVEKIERWFRQIGQELESWYETYHFRFVKQMSDVRYMIVDSLVAIGGDGYRSWLQLERDTTTKYHSLRRTVRDNVKQTKERVNQLKREISEKVDPRIVSFGEQLLTESVSICQISENNNISSWGKQGQTCGLTYSTQLEAPSSDHQSFEAYIVFPSKIFA